MPVFYCDSCGKQVKRSVVGAGLCRSCSQRANALKRDYTRSGEVVLCENCGEAFYAPPSEAARGAKFCSQRCMGIAARKKRSCSICGGEFDSRGPKKTCSRDCANKAKARAKRGELNPQFSSGVAERKRAWKATAEKTCRSCGVRGKMHVHHVVYEQHVKKEHGDIYDVRNSLSLCFRCHMQHHHGADRRISTAKLRPENFEFARELLGEAADLYFIRYYDPPLVTE